jgi:hypothetical protein
MDPYLEDRRIWPSVHHRMISAISDALTPQVAPYFYVTIEERVYIAGPEEDEPGPVVPDLFLVKHPEAVGGTGSAAQAPLEVRDRYIEVRDASGQEVVTTIEVLSPRNKASRTRGRRAFLAKRRAVMSAATSWVEIDLLRGGERPDEVAHQSDYYALLKRRGHVDRLEVWFVNLRDALPVIAVPLREPFPDALLDLGAVVTDVYTRGTYAVRLDYAKPPPPQLRRADSAWATERIAVWRR